MKTAIHYAVLATAFLCATAAFAANKAVVNIPFNFASHGKTYPAGQYVATVDPLHNVLMLRSATNTKLSAHWITGPADSNPENEKLILMFDSLGNRHTLRTVQLGSRITSRLDAPSRRDANSTLAEVRGQ